MTSNPKTNGWVDFVNTMFWAVAVASLPVIVASFYYKTVSNEHTRKIAERREDRVRLEEETGMYKIERFNWEEHTYIRFHGGNYGGRSGVVHDPDCSCGIVQKNEEN